jgi:hypothetical protein
VTRRNSTSAASLRSFELTRRGSIPAYLGAGDKPPLKVITEMKDLKMIVESSND